MFGTKKKLNFYKMDKQTKKEIIDSLEKRKTYRAYVDEFGSSVNIEAKNLEEAEEKVLELIDIHEINEDGEIIDG